MKSRLASRASRFFYALFKVRLSAKVQRVTLIPPDICPQS
jgi:hypothetical protein